MLTAVSVLVLSALAASFGARPVRAALPSDFSMTITAAELGADPAVLRATVPLIQAEITQDGGLSASIEQDLRANNPSGAGTIDVAAIPDFDGRLSLTPDGGGMTITVPGGAVQTTAVWWHNFVAMVIGALAGYGLRIVCIGALASTGVGAATIPLVCTPLQGAVTGLVSGIVVHAFAQDLNTRSAWIDIVVRTLVGLAVGVLWEKYFAPFAKNYVPGAFKSLGTWIRTRIPALQSVFGAPAAAAAEESAGLMIEMEPWADIELRTWDNGVRPPLRDPMPPASVGRTDVRAADPSAIKMGSTYHSVESKGDGLYARSASSLAGLSNALPRLIWSDPGMGEIWAPEFTVIGGRYHVYFSAGRGAAHRMYVISSAAPTSGYGTHQKLALPDDRWAIDGAAFTFNSQLWFVWSGWAGTTDGEQNLYIAKMSNPTTPTGTRAAISQPREPFERVVGNPFINEGPEPIKDPNGQLHVVYSANGSWSDQYCLADLRLRAGGDPMYVWDWYKSNGCQFGSNSSTLMSGWNATKYANGPGHHSFVLPAGDIANSPPAGSRIPFLYHAVPKTMNYKWDNRIWYVGGYTWYDNLSYSRRNVPGDNRNTGYGLGFFEDPNGAVPPAPVPVPEPEPEPQPDVPPAAPGRNRNADPSVIRVGGTYYSVESDGRNIYARSSSAVTGLAGAAKRLIWAAPMNMSNVWAPDLVRLDDSSYIIYFASGDGAGGQRMYTTYSTKPDREYTAPMRLSLPDGKWAVDGTAFKFGGKMWFVWSGWEGDTNVEQNIYLAEMNGPLSVKGPRKVISQPREAFERVTGNPFINEAPQPIKDPNGQLHIVYSANGSWTDQYCVADLRLRAGGDPLQVWDWYKSNGCQFGSNRASIMNGWDPTLYVNGPGHLSFVLVNGDIDTSPPAGPKFPLMFHAVPKGTAYSWANREWFTGSFAWWGNVTYSRQNVPGATSDTGWGLKFFEDPQPAPGRTGLRNADPSVIRVGTTYYSAESDGGNIYSRSASDVTGLAGSGKRLIWSAPKNMPNVWAPDLVKVNAANGTKVYAIYFASGDGAGGQRMYYTWSNQPDRGFSDPIRLNLPDNKWAVDGTAFSFGDKMWFVWSGWEGDTNVEQNIYLAEMTSPSDVKGPRRAISQPREAFERVTGNPFINEAPQPIKDPNGQLHVVYSANGSWTDQYCVADLRLRAGGDPLYVWDWYKSNGCQFGSNRASIMNGWDPTLYVDGPGHLSFVLVDGDINTSPPAGPKFPLMFHAVPKANAYSWANREWFTGSFAWWGTIAYSRQNVPGATTDTGWSIKFFE